MSASGENHPPARAGIPRVAIVGVGGIGGYFAARLVDHYHPGRRAEFIFIQRGEHLTAIRERGLRYTTRNLDYTILPDLATDDPAAAGLFDMVLFCVKSYDLDASAKSIKENLHPGSLIISTLNGMETGRRLEMALGGFQVLAGCIYLSARGLSVRWVEPAGSSLGRKAGPWNRTATGNHSSARQA